MKFRVTIKVGYYEAFFDFADISEATAFMATAVENQAGAEDGKGVTIGMVALKKEAENDG